MSKNKRVGICHICGENRELTFEHIPPRSVFNSENSKLYNAIDLHMSGNDMWDFTGLKYKQHQKGVGRYTLCSQCNNDIGSWYVVEYAKFIMRLYNAVMGHSFRQDDQFVVYATDIYPLRIIKSVVAMFCSLNHDRFASLHDIRNFLLNKEQKGINGEYGISMYFSLGCINKQLPLSVIGYSNNRTRAVSEITWYPFGYVYDADKNYNTENFDITDFSKYGYNEKADININLIAREVNTSFPVDYRSKEQVIGQSVASLSAMEENT